MEYNTDCIDNCTSCGVELDFLNTELVKDEELDDLVPSDKCTACFKKSAGASAPDSKTKG